MNVTKHARLRYAERILGLSDDREAKQYLVQNEDEVDTEINTMYEQSVFIWTGCLNGKLSCHYHICDDVVLVVGEDRSQIVTLFRCNFGFPDSVNRQTIKGLMSEIGKLRDRRTKKGEKIGTEIAKLEVQIENIDAQINAKRAELDVLRGQRAIVDTELEVTQSAIRSIDAEIANIAMNLINSVELRKDMGKAI